MIYFDVTKASASGHHSGLQRVSQRLADELGNAVTPVSWKTWNRTLGANDWWLTCELFSEEERPGLTEWLASSPGKKAAIFHDAIPLRWPHITWPHSVARHPGYMKLLARFNHVWAVSETSRTDLLGFWRWMDFATVPPVEVVHWGADFTRGARVQSRAMPTGKSLVCVGILEPRKNQALLLDAAEALWREGLDFELHLVGRVNPHFGAPLVARIKSLQKSFRGLHHHVGADDATLARLYEGARATVFPTVAEGCGLPVLESLWMGLPCVCSDLPVLREITTGGGCVTAKVDDRRAWTESLRRVLTDDALISRLANEATTRALPTWAGAAQELCAALS